MDAAHGAARRQHGVAMGCLTDVDGAPPLMYAG